jgi:small-conductance mechanosensitive channel/CRP-like cAMP-binding protein
VSFWSALAGEASDDRTLLLAAGAIVAAVLLRAFAAEEESRNVRAFLALTALHLILLPVAAGLRAAASPVYVEFRLIAQLFGIIAAIQIAAAVVFGLLLPRARVAAPRILRDVIIGIAALGALFTLAAGAGLNLSGLIATSAVLTAVIGFAMQDTLGNLIAGLALQLDQSIKVGDWVKVGDVSGKVSEVRWRYTAIETRNWETHLLPNTVMVKSQVQLLGRRRGEPELWRRWVYFNVDFRYSPAQVIETVETAVNARPIPGVAAKPAPNAVLMDLHESYGRYALRYWLSDLQADDPTDSVVRIRIYFALKRAGIPLSMPAHAVFLTEDSAERRSRQQRDEMERRMEALAAVDIFRSLQPAELETLAAGLHHAPFAKGEALTRQGAEAHWLYLITGGEAAVRVAVDGGPEAEVARVKAGDFIGEMSLLTGEKRSATVMALTDVDCYRLDKTVFQETIRRRPEMAAEIAEVLARRRHALAEARTALGEAASGRPAASKDLLDRIRLFFHL